MLNKDLAEYYKSLDRAYFIDNENKYYAHIDTPLPIGYSQTISQPSLVLQMTDSLQIEKNSKVLEIGTGSGYQTALLAKFAKSVYTVELIKELSQSAKNKLGDMGFANIFYKIGDGSLGWEEHSPYDRIIGTAAAQEIPDELIKQLNYNGRMIIPIGPKDTQELLLITKDDKGTVKIEVLNMVRFVEMKGRYGWSSDN
ncbi:MAG: protein-L-isoaspartate(D-aspartate) O-methyltransferase [Eubacteriaceae bacterium]